MSRRFFLAVFSDPLLWKLLDPLSSLKSQIWRTSFNPRMAPKFLFASRSTPLGNVIFKFVNLPVVKVNTSLDLRARHPLMVTADRLRHVLRRC